MPVTDPVDRRNAVFMQLLMAYEGLRIVLMKIYLLTVGWFSMAVAFFDKTVMGATVSMAVDLGTDLAMAVSAWLGIYLIRVGKFRTGVKQYLATQLVCGVLAYATFGYKSAPGESLLLIPLALGGLVLGRKALWTIYASVILVLLTGMTSDYLHAGGARDFSYAYGNLVFRSFSYLIVTIVLDRSISALREALDESNARRRRLLQEIAERESAQEHLLHSRKMDAIGRLSQGIAHDFNDVLDVVLGLAQERHRVDEPGTTRPPDVLALEQALLGVEMAAQRGEALTGKLLDFSREEVRHVEAFDVAQATRNLELMLRRIFPPQVELRINTPERPLLIDFDQSQFELAILNIASNARDAMPDGGRFEINLMADGASHVVLVLSDTGIGMPKAVKTRIFEPFFTSKPVGHGTGVGLTVVYRLVTEAGGRIDVESQEGRGTTFRLRLPLSSRVADVARPASAAASPPTLPARI